MLSYKIRPMKQIQRRKKNKYILFSQFSNFYNKKAFIEPELLTRTTYYSYPKVKNYFYERLSFERLPFHYLMFFNNGDWDVISAMPLDYASSWAKHLSDNYYIDNMYDNSIVVAVMDNYNVNTLDERMAKVAGYNIISPLCNLFHTNFRDSVVWLDDIMDWNKYNEDHEDTKELYSKMEYRLHPMKYFDKLLFNVNAIDYMR